MIEEGEDEKWNGINEKTRKKDHKKFSRKLAGECIQKKLNEMEHYANNFRNSANNCNERTFF